MTDKTCYDAENQIYYYGDEYFSTFEEIRDHYANEGITLTDGLPDDHKASDVRKERDELLAETDWVVIRKADNDTAIPSNIQTWRNAIRTKATEMETAIDNAADTDAVAALFVTYATNEDGSITKSGILHDWPELGD